MGKVILLDLAPPLTQEEELELAEIRGNPENNYARFVALLKKQSRHDAFRRHDRSARMVEEI